MDPRRLFLSYARRDGLEPTQKLRDLLTAADPTLDIWLDLNRITGGTSWSKAIDTALDRCHILLAIITEASDASEMCRSEQITALEAGKLVIPVLASPTANLIARQSALNPNTDLKNFTNPAICRNPQRLL